MSATAKIDLDYVTQNLRKNWNGWNYMQRSTWAIFHDLPISIADFDDLPTPIQDALFCEYLDNAKRHLE